MKDNILSILIQKAEEFKMGNVQKSRGRKRRNNGGIGLKVGLVVAIMQILSVFLYSIRW